jgi:DNA-binding response OmpR family regulator
MGPMDGWQVLKSTRSDSKYLTVPVVMLTGKYPTMKEIDEFAISIDGYLMKPFAIERLKHEIEMVLERVKSRRSHSSGPE